MRERERGQHTWSQEGRGGVIDYPLDILVRLTGELTTIGAGFLAGTGWEKTFSRKIGPILARVRLTYYVKQADSKDTNEVESVGAEK